MSSSNTSENKTNNKTWSRDSLYAPLSRYLENNNNNDDCVVSTAHSPNNTKNNAINNTPNIITTTKKKKKNTYKDLKSGTIKENIPAGLRQSAYVDWIEKVSKYYLGSSSINGDIHNGGGIRSGICGKKPLKRAQIETKIVQRSLIMVGGGVHKSLEQTNNNNAVSNSNNNNNNKKKKRIGNVLSNKKRKKLEQLHQSKKGNNVKDDVVAMLPDILILQNLNQMWGHYIYHLTKSCRTVNELSCKISNAELAGALVCILECPARSIFLLDEKRSASNSASSAVYGLILSESQNMYTVAKVDLVKEEDGTKRKQKLQSSFSSSHNKSSSIILHVPKRNTKLAIRLKNVKLWSLMDQQHEEIC
eukprot:CAMPEP_0178964854 /NCGR_PEP_ID=MMETSP0789-20121207/15923_1 /TAXON_ID=3005 /ORGANISM="Rhizosolenia setigera, Strain CCMP 1694" /LENGTH=360 /DNA_ID=CAMNT_0020649705 /DNA_START=72 /DNA_END=1151 /DNA_ORIENTATION=-